MKHRPLPSEAEMDRIERQLAQALQRGQGYKRADIPDVEPVHDSPVYAELERLSRNAPSHPQGASGSVRHRATP